MVRQSLNRSAHLHFYIRLDYVVCTSICVDLGLCSVQLRLALGKSATRVVHDDPGSIVGAKAQGVGSAIEPEASALNRDIL